MNQPGCLVLLIVLVLCEFGFDVPEERVGYEEQWWREGEEG